MRGGIVLALVTVASLRSVTAQAPPQEKPSDNTVTIGFEELNSGGVGEATHTAVINDYPDVTFDHPFVVDFSRGRQVLLFPHGGTRAIMFCDVGVPCSSNGFVIHFANPQKRVRIWAGALFLQKNVTVSLSAMDASGAIVARTEDTLIADAVRHIGTPLDVQTDSNRITSVTVQADNPNASYLAFDDVEFERAPSASGIVAEQDKPPVMDTLTGGPTSIKTADPWWRNSWLPVVIVVLVIGAGAAGAKHLVKAKPPAVKPRLADSGIDKRIASVKERDPLNISIGLSLRPGSTRIASNIDQRQGPQVKR
jgi:hypothetical protein